MRAQVTLEQASHLIKVVKRQFIRTLPKSLTWVRVSLSAQVELDYASHFIEIVKRQFIRMLPKSSTWVRSELGQATHLIKKVKRPRYTNARLSKR